MDRLTISGRSTIQATSVRGRSESTSLCTFVPYEIKENRQMTIKGCASGLMTRWLPLNVGLTVGEVSGWEGSDHSCLVLYSFWPTAGATLPWPDHFPFICRRIRGPEAVITGVVTMDNSKCGAQMLFLTALDSRNSWEIHFLGSRKNSSSLVRLVNIPSFQYGIWQSIHESSNKMQNGFKCTLGTD